MRVYGLLGKTGEPRHVYEPLGVEDEMMSDRQSEVYTPIEDHSDSRMSSMGRLSVTQS